MIILSFLPGIIIAYMLAEQGICADLPKPTLSVNPAFRVFPRGERIILTCGCQCPVTRVHYYRNKQPNPVSHPDAKNGLCPPSYILDAQLSGEANYTCSCLHNDNVKWKTSEKSEPIQISIRGPGTAFPLTAVLGCAAATILAIFVAVPACLFARRRKTKRLNIERCTASASGMANQQDGDLAYLNQSGSSNPEMNGIYSEVRENDNEEINYASLNLAALSRKNAASTSAPGANIPAEKKRSELAKSEYQDVTYATVRVDSGAPK